MKIAFVHEFLLRAYSNKDVVQVPSTLAKSLGCDWSYITRPLPGAADVLVEGSVEFVGKEPDGANAANLNSGNEGAVKYSETFALRAGWAAAASADVYIGMFLNLRSLLGVLGYRLGRLARRRPGFVYLKADLSHMGRSRFERKVGHDILIYGLFRVFDWVLARSTDIVSIETEDGRNWLRRVYRSLSAKVVVVRNCPVTSSHGAQAQVSRDDTIVAVGRLGAYEKAADILLPAFRRFSETHPTWRLSLVGESSPRLVALAESYSDMIQDGRIRLIGYVSDRDELVRIYRSATIFVQPSRWESVSIALTEAVREGCLPICTPVFCVDEIFGDYSKDLTAPLEDVYGLAGALTRLVAQRERWDEMRNYLLERTSNWNWEDQLAPIASAIQRKLSGRERIQTTEQGGSPGS